MTDDRARLATLEAQFEAAGGRGVELAEEIDTLRRKLSGATTISRTTFTFTVLHRTDEPLNDLRAAMEEAWTGHAVGLDECVRTEPVPDTDVPDALAALGNDGTFFDMDLEGE